MKASEATARLGWASIHYDPEESYYARIGVNYSNQNYPAPESTGDWYILVANILKDFARMAADDFQDAAESIRDTGEKPDG